MGDMIAMTYLSRATAALDRAELEALLRVARERNTEAGVTGLLLYADRHFIQTLEGARDAVEATMRRIAADGRHEQVEVVFVEDVAERGFPEWSMGFRVASREEAADLPGFTDFLQRPDAADDDATELGHAAAFHRAFRALAPAS